MDAPVGDGGDDAVDLGGDGGLFKAGVRGSGVASLKRAFISRMVRISMPDMDLRARSERRRLFRAVAKSASDLRGGLHPLFG